MPEVQNLDHIGAFLDAVVNQDWSMDKLAHAGAPGYRAADVWKRLQQIDMVEDGIAKAFSVRREVGSGVFEDVLEVD